MVLILTVSADRKPGDAELPPGAPQGACIVANCMLHKLAACRRGVELPGQQRRSVGTYTCLLVAPLLISCFLCCSCSM